LIKLILPELKKSRMLAARQKQNCGGNVQPQQFLTELLSGWKRYLQGI